MPSVEDFLNLVKDEALSGVKKEFKDLLDQAAKEELDFVKETAELVKNWAIQRVKGEITNDGFERLLRARKRVVMQELNTLEIKARARVEKIVMGVVDIVLDKFLGKIV